MKWLAVGLLLAGLALPAVAPEVANVTVLALAALALLLHLGAKSWRSMILQPAVAMPLAAGLLLALAFAFSAQSPLEVAAVFYFAPLFVVAPLALLLMHLPPLKAGWLISSAALLGVVGSALVASYDAFILRLGRAGDSVANPIHFADVSLMLGFVAVTGSILAPRQWRPLYLAGPVLAGYSIYLSGSRGPLLAFVVLIAAGLAFWSILNYSRREAWTRAALIAVVYCAFVVLAWKLGWLDRVGRFSGLVGSIEDGLSLPATPGTPPPEAIDGSTQQRLIMYRTAYSAFLASPLFGHGLVDFIDKAARYAPQGVEFPRYDHLHSDLADFAVVGGLMGLLAYCLLLLAPIAQAIRSRRSPMGPAIMLLALSASLGYFAMGLTNAMFGLLTQTVLYGLVLALVTQLSLRAIETMPGPSTALP